MTAEKKTQRSIMEKRRQNGARIETGGEKTGSENLGKRKPKTTTTSGKGDSELSRKTSNAKLHDRCGESFWFFFSQHLCVNKGLGENLEQFGV